MVGGPIKIESIRWNERTMDLRGCAEYLVAPLTFTVAYRHVCVSMLVDDSGMQMHVQTSGGGSYCMHFECPSNAREAAAELARRMEACA